MFAVVSLEDANGDRTLYILRWPLHVEDFNGETNPRRRAGPFTTRDAAADALIRFHTRQERQAQLEWQDTAPYYQDVTSKEGLI